MRQLKAADVPVPIEVHQSEPVLEGRRARLVLFGEHKPDEARIVQVGLGARERLLARTLGPRGAECLPEGRVGRPRRRRGARPRRVARARGPRIKHPIRDACAQGIVVVTAQVLPGEAHVVVVVQLPELAVDHIEVLVGEEAPAAIHLLLAVEEGEGVGKPRARERAARHAPRATARRGVEHPQHHGVHVALLEVRGGLEEAQARVKPHHGLRHLSDVPGLEVRTRAPVQRRKHTSVRAEAAEPLAGKGEGLALVHEARALAVP
mmetsp:Transcript_7932/g.26912  ORF Transcript_7932/g.26912 Transcript_7932/m.26912 type:complete len:264 (+) Transcript_7932:832-1623(+)